MLNLIAIEKKMISSLQKKCPFSTSFSNELLAHIDYFENGKYLIGFSELNKKFDHDVLEQYSKEIVIARNYLTEFVAKENNELGREGVVCPYTPGAILKESLFLTVYKDNLSNREQSKKVVLDYMDLFLRIEPTKGKCRDFKSIIILLPEVSSDYAEEVVEKVQNELKPYFVKNGLMLGQFYPQCESPGIRNPEFRPLQSPIPLLVIRYMVKTDYIFLEDYQQEYFDNFKDKSDVKAKQYFNTIGKKKWYAHRSA